MGQCVDYNLHMESPVEVIDLLTYQIGLCIKEIGCSYTWVAWNPQLAYAWIMKRELRF